MRRRFLVLVPLLIGCGTHERAVSRVVLPAGVHRSANLTPDPPPEPPLNRPAAHVQEDDEPPPRTDRESSVSLGMTDGPGVEAVCRYDESDVQCWKPDGGPLPTLGAQLKSILSQGGAASLPLAVGRKTRLVVALTPTEPAGSTAQWSVVAAHPGTEGYSGPNLGLGLGGRTRSIVLVSEKPTAATSALRFIERKRLPKEVPVALKQGSSTSLGGYRLTVSHMGKLSESDANRFMVRNRPSWLIVITRTGSSPHSEEFFPVDPYPIVQTADGRRMSLQKGKVDFAPEDAPAMQTVYDSRLPEGAVAVIIDRDPAKVKRLMLGGWELRSMVLDGVPLEPKG